MGVPYAEVIGDPIAHSKSPLIHKFWLRNLGIEGDYRATRVAVGVLALAAAWMVVDAVGGGVPSWLAGWDHWDAQLFVKVARFGYQGYPQHYPDKDVVVPHLRLLDLLEPQPFGRPVAPMHDRLHTYSVS